MEQARQPHQDRARGPPLTPLRDQQESSDKGRGPYTSFLMDPCYRLALWPADHPAGSDTFFPRWLRLAGCDTPSWDKQEVSLRLTWERKSADEYRNTK